MLWQTGFFCGTCWDNLDFLADQAKGENLADAIKRLEAKEVRPRPQGRW